MPLRHDGQHTSVFQKSGAMSSASHKNILVSDNRKLCFMSRVPRSQEGRLAIVTNVERGMRWTRSCRKTCGASRTVKPCGPVPATLGSTPGSRARGDGGKKARFTGESTEQPLNHRAGNAVMLRHTCSDYARLLFHFANEAAGAAGARHSLRPLRWGDMD